MKKIILQDHQLNQLVASVTSKSLDGKSFPDGAISGDEIMKFSNHSQVNNFILFQIYQDWTAMMQKLQHPFFDYNAPDVKEGLSNFLNILSRNIKVPLADFKKMLQQAVYNTLKLILNPEDAYSNFFFMNAPAIPLELFKKHSVYFKDFDFAVRSLQRFFEKNKMAKVERSLFLEKFSKVVDIFEKKNNTEIYTYQKALFKSLTGQDLDPLVEEAKKAPVKTPTPSIESRPVSSPPAAKPPVEAKADKDVPDWIKQEQDRRKRAQRDTQAENAKELATKQPAAEKPVTGQPVSKEQPVAKEPPVTKSQPVKKEPVSKEAPAGKVDPATQPPANKQPVTGKDPEAIEAPAAKQPVAKAQPNKQESPSAKEPPAAKEKNEKTVSSAHQESQAEKRSINDVFSQEEGEKPRRKVASLLSGRGGAKNEPKEEEPETSEEKEAPEGARKSTIDLFAQAKKAESALKDKKTVAEALGTKDDKGKSSVNQALGEKMIRTEQIPVHKQFQFVQKVFGGSSVKFKVVLDKINKTENIEEAESVLNRYVFNDPSVNRNDKVCKEFVGLVKERFEE